MSTTTSLRGRPVVVNVYDLVRMNNLLFDVGLGVLHSGVVIDGHEYSYGEGGGIISTAPKNVLGITFREEIAMGNTYLSPNQIKDVIRNLGVRFNGTSYNMVKNNCNHFSDEFCHIIVCKRIPAYINRCASIGKWLSGVATNVATNVAAIVDKIDKIDIPITQIDSDPLQPVPTYIQNNSKSEINPS